jgi:tRNA (cmo5U34)-methyltransferase
MQVGDKIECKTSGWSFNGTIVDAFETHVSRSVPFYHEGHTLITHLSNYFIKKNSVCYDLGCSTGLLTYQLAKYCSDKNVTFIGIDCEEDMINYAKSKYQLPNIEFVYDNIEQYYLEKTNFITAYYILQFVELKYRKNIIAKVYDALEKGGAFLFFEKVRASNARLQDIMTGLYTDYKITQGYSLEEILAKSQSLKGVLEPLTTEENIELLKEAGFKDIITIAKYITFEGFLAIK